MTNKMTAEEARRILIDIADQMPSDICADWIDAVCIGIKAINAQLMRDATKEERKSVKDYIESISKPTGMQFEAQPCEDCISNYIKQKIDYLENLASIETNEGRWREEEKYLYAISVLEEIVEYIETDGGGEDED